MTFAYLAATTHPSPSTYSSLTSNNPIPSIHRPARLEHLLFPRGDLLAMPTTLVRIAPAPPDEPEPRTSTSSPSPSPSRFAEPADGDGPDLATVVRRIRGAKRIVVVCGAGVSTAARIPDFRSAHGLFAGSRGHGVKDLFHVKSLSVSVQSTYWERRVGGDRVERI